MLDEKTKKEILENNFVLNKIKDTKKISKFEKDKNKILIISTVISLFLIGYIYFNSSYSKTFKISVVGNTYLSEEDILNEANISDIFLFTKPSTIEKRLKKIPLIEDAEVTMLDGKIVKVEVTEHKAIGYIIEDSEIKLLLINGDKYTLNENNMYLISKVPYIEGYTSEELEQIRYGFSDVDYSTINEMSEIHKYPVSYDQIYMEVIMADGNYAFLSYYDLYTLKDYYGVSSGIDKSKGYACIYFDGQTNSATASACPWQRVIEASETVEEVTE